MTSRTSQVCVARRADGCFRGFMFGWPAGALDVHHDQLRRGLLHRGLDPWLPRRTR